MRQLARRVGAALREQVGFRGSFSIDGVLAEEGFLPTELNPRLGGGMSTLAGALGDFPLTPLCLAIAEGERLDYRPELLEQAVLEAADAHRVCGGGRAIRRKLTETGTLDLRRDGDDYREAATGEDPDATTPVRPGTDRRVPAVHAESGSATNPDRHRLYKPREPSASQIASSAPTSEYSKPRGTSGRELQPPDRCR